MRKKNAKHQLVYVMIGLCFLMGLLSANAQNNFTVSGTLRDQINGETLFGASIYLKGTTIGAVTNEYGFYSISAPAGNYTLVFSYMGYKENSMEINLNSDQKIDMELEEFSTQLEEVEVVAEEPERAILRKPEMSISKLNIKTVKQNTFVTFTPFKQNQ